VENPEGRLSRALRVLCVLERRLRPTVGDREDLFPSRLELGTVDPAAYDVFVVKSRVHFRRGFDETGFAPTIIVVEAPEPFVGTTFLDGLPYEHVDLRQLFPYGTPANRR